MTPGLRSSLPLARGLVALTLFGALSLAFAADSTSLSRLDTASLQAPVLAVGDDYAQLASRIEHDRADAMHIGLAIRESAAGELSDVVAPTGLLGLATASDVLVDGGLVSTLNARTIGNLLAGTYRELDYDPHLTRGELALIERRASIDEYPGGVLVVVPHDETLGAAGRYVLHADANNSVVLVVPYSLSPLRDIEDAVAR